MIAYIIAGAILGFYSPEIIRCIRVTTIPLAMNLLLAFVGGVAGHLLFTLLNS